MTSKPKRICLVSGSHVCSNPRLVKEAQALHDAGYYVHVVAGRYHSPYDERDQQILSKAPWDYTLVNYGTGLRGIVQKLARTLARGIIRLFSKAPLVLAARAHHAASAQISSKAKQIPADLYIGHTLVGLFGASTAASSNRAKFGFDAEDFHSQETDFAITDYAEKHSIQRLESSLLPECRHLTAASPLIAEAYSKTYGVPLPFIIQNTFPKEEAPSKPSLSASIHSPVRIYWFSQTIGSGRGLEQLIPVLARLSTPTELNLRGKIFQSSYPDSLRELAHELGFKGRISFLPPAPAAQMAQLATEHDFGLATEITTPLNRDICLTNKIYTYLLAGLPILCTPTRAQKKLADELGPAARIIELDNPVKCVAQIEDWIADKETYSQARHHAWNLGQTRFNWDSESKRLIAAVEECFSNPTATNKSIA